MTETISRRNRDEHRQRPTNDKKFDIPQQHMGAVSKLHGELKQLEFNFSYFDCYTALQDCKFDHDHALDYVINGQYKGWKVSPQKAYGDHVEQKQMHSKHHQKRVTLKFFEEPIEEPTFEIIDAEPERPAAFITVVMDSEAPADKKAKSTRRSPKKEKAEQPEEPVAKKVDVAPVVIEEKPEVIEKIEEPKKAPRARKSEKTERTEKGEKVEKSEEPKREPKPRAQKKAVEAPKAVEEIKIEVTEEQAKPELNIEIVEPTPVVEQQKQAEQPVAPPMAIPYAWPFGMPYGHMMPSGMMAMPPNMMHQMPPGMMAPPGMMPPGMIPQGMMPMFYGMPMPGMIPGYPQQPAKPGMPM